MTILMVAFWLRIPCVEDEGSFNICRAGATQLAIRLDHAECCGHTMSGSVFSEWKAAMTDEEINVPADGSSLRQACCMVKSTTAAAPH
jgi:hypothetical protein